MNRRKEYHKKYYQKHRKRINQRNKKYNQEHKEVIKKYKKTYYQKNKNRLIKYSIIWQKENKKKACSYKNKYFKQRKKTDVNFKILGNLRTRLYKILKRNSKRKSTINLLGCTIPELKFYLKKQFKPGMTWENYGKWHIDHIKQCCTFNLNKPEEQRKCFNYKNLRPLWAEENLRRPRQK